MVPQMTLQSNFSLKCLIIFSLCLALSGSEAGEDCFINGSGSINGQPLTLHEDRNNFRFLCCATVKCPPGTEAKVCTRSDPLSTACNECAPGTFQESSFESSWNYQCDPHRKCLKGSKPVSEGNSTTDTVCVCDLQDGYYGIGLDCHNDKSCPAGSQLLLNGSCEHCPKNFYKKSNDSRRCEPCSECDETTLGVLSKCTAIHDTSCRSDRSGAPGGNDPYMMIIVIIAIVILLTILVVALALYLWKCRKTGSITGNSREGSTRSTSILSELEEEGKSLNPSDQSDAAVTEIQNQNLDVPLIFDHKVNAELQGSRISLCSWIYSRQHQENTASHNESQSASHIDLRSSTEYTVETELDNKQQRGQPERATVVTMTGKMNIYAAGNVVVNINNKNKDRQEFIPEEGLSGLSV